MESLDGYNVGGHKLKIQLSSVGLDNTITEDIVEIDENCLNGPGANTGVRFRPRPQGVGAHASAQGWDEWTQFSKLKIKIFTLAETFKP